MTREDYLKMSKGLATQVFFIADRAAEIIRKCAQESGDDDGYLWTNAVDEIWIQDGKTRVVYIYADKHQTFIGVQDEYCEDEDDTHEAFLSDLNPWDRIEIADYLVEHEL